MTSQKELDNMMISPISSDAALQTYKALIAEREAAPVKDFKVKLKIESPPITKAEEFKKHGGSLKLATPEPNPEGPAGLDLSKYDSFTFTGSALRWQGGIANLFSLPELLLKK